jgi:hypothetical protein
MDTFLSILTDFPGTELASFGCIRQKFTAEDANLSTRFNRFFAEAAHMWFCR